MAEVTKGTVISRRLNVRLGAPNLNSPQHEGQLVAGDEVTITASLKGDPYNGNDNWFRLENGSYVWAGGIETTLEMKEQRKVIITADDYGVYDPIDSAVRDSLSDGWINSVAVLPNVGKDGADSRRRAEDLLNHVEKNNIKDFQFGLHFTISSGQPILPKKEVPSLCTHKGFKHFLSITDLNPDELTQLRAELEAQIDVFSDLPVTNFSCHHNSLYFFPSYLKILLDLAADHDMPIRNFNMIPERKHKLLRLISGGDMVSVRKLNRVLKKWEKKRKVDIQMPDITFAGHYGPLPPFRVTKSKLEKCIRAKVKGIEDLKDRFSESNWKTMEIVIHMIEGKLKSQKTFKEEFNERYAGVDPAYFDGRVTEFLALQKWKENLGSGFTDWSEV